METNGDLMKVTLATGGRTLGYMRVEGSMVFIREPEFTLPGKYILRGAEVYGDPENLRFAPEILVPEDLTVCGAGTFVARTFRGSDQERQAILAERAPKVRPSYPVYPCMSREVFVSLWSAYVENGETWRGGPTNRMGWAASFSFRFMLLPGRAVYFVDDRGGIVREEFRDGTSTRGGTSILQSADFDSGEQFEAYLQALTSAPPEWRPSSEDFEGEWLLQDTEIRVRRVEDGFRVFGIFDDEIVKPTRREAIQEYSRRSREVVASYWEAKPGSAEAALLKKFPWV